MAAIVWGDVIAHASALEDVPDIVRADALEFANTQLKVSLFGGEASIKTRLARIYLAAHLGQLWVDRSGSGAGGDVQSETFGADSITINYGETDMSEDALKQTAHGRAYLSIVNMSAARVGFIAGCGD